MYIVHENNNTISFHFIVIGQPAMVSSGSEFEIYAIPNSNGTESISMGSLLFCKHKLISYRILASDWLTTNEYWILTIYILFHFVHIWTKNITVSHKAMQIQIIIKAKSKPYNILFQVWFPYDGRKTLFEIPFIFDIVKIANPFTALQLWYLLVVEHCIVFSVQCSSDIWSVFRFEIHSWWFEHQWFQFSVLDVNELTLFRYHMKTNILSNL